MIGERHKMLGLAVALVAAGLAGWSSIRATGPDADNPYANDKDAVAAGRKLFLHHCASCHGENATGTHRAPSLITETVARSSPRKLERLLRDGSMRRGMPSWSALPEQRRWQIVSYLETLHDR